MFARFRHEHVFVARAGGTTMLDRLDFASPLGPFGRLVDALLVGPHLARFLERRNAVLRDLAPTFDLLASTDGRARRSLEIG